MRLRSVHYTGLFGGTLLTISSRVPLPTLEQYLESASRWADITRRMGVDVELLNHPLFDDLFMKLESLEARRPREPHPLVVGEDAYQRFVGIMAECTHAHIARRPSE